MKKFFFIIFIKQVYSEITKITWPTKNETFITTLMVIFMILISVIFFFISDQIISLIIRFLLGI